MTIYYNAPDCCDICKAHIRDSFTDGFNPHYHTWANHCPACADAFGVRLGTGKGQRYDKQADGQFHKVALGAAPMPRITRQDVIEHNAWLLDDDFDA